MKTLHLFDFDGTISEVDSTSYYFRKKLGLILFTIVWYIIPFGAILKYVLHGDSYKLKVHRIKSGLRFIRFLKKDYSFSQDSLNSIVFPKAIEYISQLKQHQTN